MKANLDISHLVLARQPAALDRDSCGAAWPTCISPTATARSTATCRRAAGSSISRRICKRSRRLEIPDAAISIELEYSPEPETDRGVGRRGVREDGGPDASGGAAAVSRVSGLLARLALALALIGRRRLAGAGDGAGGDEPSTERSRRLAVSGRRGRASGMRSLGSGGVGGAAPRDRADWRGRSRLAIETDRAWSLATEAIALPLGILLAILLFRTDVWGRRLLLALIGLAAFVPLPLHATAWLGALGNAGRMQAFGVRPILVGRVGAAVVHALAALPWVVLIVGRRACARSSPSWRSRPCSTSGRPRRAARHPAAGVGCDRRGRAGGRRADRRRHDRHRPAPDPHLRRGGLSPVQPGTRAWRSGRRRAAAAGRPGAR